MPVKNLPSGSVGLHDPLAACLTIGLKILPVTFFRTPRSGKKGLISSWPVQSTKAGRTLVARKDAGFDFCTSARASSVSPLMRPKKGVRRPGVNVAPSPET